MEGVLAEIKNSKVVAKLRRTFSKEKESAPKYSTTKPTKLTYTSATATTQQELLITANNNNSVVAAMMVEAQVISAPREPSTPRDKPVQGGSIHGTSGI